MVKELISTFGEEVGEVVCFEVQPIFTPFDSFWQIDQPEMKQALEALFISFYSLFKGWWAGQD